MTSWQIVMAALHDLRKDRDATLRIFLGPVLVIFVAQALGARFVPQVLPSAIQAQGMAAIPKVTLVYVLAALVLQAALYSIAAVAWHRFVLKGEAPGRLFPQVHGKAALAYFVTGLVQVVLTMIVVLLMAVGIGIGIGIVIGLTGAATHLAKSALVWAPAVSVLIGVVFGSWMILRLGCVLPGVAVSGHRPILSGLHATVTHRKTLMGVTFYASILSGVLVGIGGIFSRVVPFLGLGGAVTGFALLSFNAALLTVLYQQFVQASPDTV